MDPHAGQDNFATADLRRRGAAINTPVDTPRRPSPPPPTGTVPRMTADDPLREPSALTPHPLLTPLSPGRMKNGRQTSEKQVRTPCQLRARWRAGRWFPSCVDMPILPPDSTFTGMAIKIKTDREIGLIREASILSAEILARAGELVKPGITTEEINTFVHKATIKAGAIPAPLNYHGFPKSVCTSVNDVVCHGIPGKEVLKEGDIINIDVTCLLAGYHGDTSATFAVGNISPDAKKLMEVTEHAMEDGIAAAAPGGYFGDIGSAIQELADEFGYGIVREFCGHGIGRGFHEDPMVLHYRTRDRGDRIREGMVFTVEPMLNLGKPGVFVEKDGWTVRTKDGSLSAQYEHTVAITRNGPEVLTRLD